MASREEQVLKGLRNATGKYRLMQSLSNGLKNLRSLVGKMSITSLGQPLRGRAAIVVSAGPSLDKNIAQLRAARSKAALFAVNTALPALRAHDVRPDAVCVLEAMDVSDQLEGATSVIAALSTHPRTMHLARFVLLEATMCWLKVARALGVKPLEAGPSVACMALAIATELGADPIILVGQDLSYDLGRGRAYATGAR